MIIVCVLSDYCVIIVGIVRLYGVYYVSSVLVVCDYCVIIAGLLCGYDVSVGALRYYCAISMCLLRDSCGMNERLVCYHYVISV